MYHSLFIFYSIQVDCNKNTVEPLNLLENWQASRQLAASGGEKEAIVTELEASSLWAYSWFKLEGFKRQHFKETNSLFWEKGVNYGRESEMGYLDYAENWGINFSVQYWTFVNRNLFFFIFYYCKKWPVPNSDLEASKHLQVRCAICATNCGYLMLLEVL